jgi:hypothetical protein
MSYALFNHVALSELWPESAPPYDDFVAEVVGLRVSIDLSPRVAILQDDWPRYPDDEYVGRWAETGTPLLMMNGDLDPQTPIWVGGRAADHFTGENQHFYTIPLAAHCVVGQSPVETEGGQACGMQIMLSFLADPAAEPDTACLGDLSPVDFAGVPEYVEYLFGASDLWENTGGAKARVLPVPPPSLERALRSARRASFPAHQL